MTTKFTFTAKVWLYSGKGAWHFVTLPQDVADEINFLYAHEKRGWGSLRVRVKVRGVSFETSIFTDKKTESFLLPLKADVRKEAKIAVDDEVEFEIEIRV